MCVCVCVCVCLERERRRGNENMMKRLNAMKLNLIEVIEAKKGGEEEEEEEEKKEEVRKARVTYCIIIRVCKEE